jgi:hypothetical protein
VRIAIGRTDYQKSPTLEARRWRLGAWGWRVDAGGWRLDARG